MYPADVKRASGHPSPFPDKLPARLIRLHTCGALCNFPGELIPDPFVGTGTTLCEQRSGPGPRGRRGDYSMLFVGSAKYPTKAELERIAEIEAGSAGRKAESKHKRKTYARELGVKEDEQLTLV